MKEMVGGCCVCSDDRGWPENPLVYCDGQSCTVAVHQACYGIVTVPTGPWYCRKCESQERTARVKCELCPSKHGALKRTDNSGWAHVVCALYIPEVRFGNVTTMEPIQLQLIPTERFSKVCYICEEQGKPANAAVGACMQCNKAGCKQQFHVTCAQSLGLLCEEAGNYLDNVKYCGYCQHHYSKLKKGGNVKTIPPYKPIATENHLSDSNSEKDTEANAALSNIKLSSQTPTLTGKRSKSSSTNKSSTTSTSKSSVNTKTSSSSSVHQKTVHNNSNKSDKDKPKVPNTSLKGVKSEDSVTINSTDITGEVKTEKVPDRGSVLKDTKSEIGEIDSKVDIKETKSIKRRKTNSRTPTPISIINDSVIPAANLSVLIPELSASVLSGITGGTTTIINCDKRDGKIIAESSEKIKKVKLEHNQPPPTPIIIAASPASVPSVVKSAPSPPQPLAPTDQAIIPSALESGGNSSIIQIATSTSSHNSLVVSVPLLNTNLISHTHIINNQTSVVTSSGLSNLSQEKNHDSSSNIVTDLTMTGASNSQSTGVITSEMSGGGLKITYEKQPAAGSTLRSELERGVTNEQTVPNKRSRSMSGEKVERGSRNKKRGPNANVAPVYTTTKRASRSQHSTPPPHPSIIPVNQIKESPPSSPSSENQSLATSRTTRTKGRKSAPAVVSTSSTKDSKDSLSKMFHNGVSAPHMLGNQLNPNSNMAQKMSDHLNSELEAHSCFNSNEQNHLIGPQLHHRVLASVGARAASSGGSSNTSVGSGFSMLSGSGGTIPQTLDQLLERQWEQGSQFLMEQAQHFDIASLLSCLHQLRAENLRLEEHVSSLLQRRDHLLAVNARLAIPLTGQPATAQPPHSHTVNNIHPSVVSGHNEMPRSRHSSGYSSHSQVPAPHPSVPVENGLPNEQNQTYPHQHRSPANNQSQSNSNMRHSPAGTSGYPSSGLGRASTDSGRTAPRPQPYNLYQGPGPSNAQTQMVIRRESDMHHQPSSKPS